MKADRALDHYKADVLDRSAFVAALARVLVEPTEADGKTIGHRATGVVAGLTGSWGAGKSSVLNLLAESLGSKTGVVVALFNPWLLGNRDALLTDLFKTIRAKFLASTVDTVRALASDVDRYWRAVDAAGYAVALGLDANGGAGNATVGWSQLTRRARSIFQTPPGDLVTARRALEGKIKDAGVAVVVLIDELDRVEDDEVREVARLVKAVGDIVGISYLVAYDPVRVADALGRGHGEARRESGEAYLEKIIQYPIPLRPLRRDDIDCLLAAMLDDVASGLLGDRESELFKTIVASIRTPRDVKRLAGAFEIFWRIGAGEIRGLDVLAYSWLTIKYPAIRDRIAQVPQRVVSDPANVSDWDFIQDLHQNETLEVRLNRDLPKIKFSHHADRLLRKMFPVLAGTGDNVWRHHDRLSQRRNLERLLYMGNPPGHVMRIDVELLWQAVDAGNAAEIIKAFQDSKRLPQLRDRIDDLITELPPTGDAPAFIAFSNIARRSASYAMPADTAVASDIANTLAHIGQRDQQAVRRIMDILDALIASGDLAIVPDMLRTEMFAHGLVEGHRARGGAAIGQLQVEALWPREARRYRAAILDGSWLRDWASAEAMYTLYNRGEWDDVLRAGLTAQLADPAAFAAFATVILPPGTSMETSVLRELLDTEMVSGWSDVAREYAATVAPWVQESILRLGKLARGINLDFDRNHI